MAKKFLVPIDLTQNELQNLRLQNLASDPSSPVLGQTYYNTTANEVRWWDGTVWQVAKSGSGSPSGTAGGSLAGTYPNPTIAAGAVGGTEIASAIKDPAAGTAGLRTLGTGGQQAAAGNDSRLSDTRTPSAGSVVDSMVASGAAIAFSKLAQPTAATPWNGQRITGLADPSSAQDAATKAYVDAAVQGLDPKPSVKAASTGNLTLSGTQTVDGVALVATDRVLVKDQSAPATNGIYVVAAGAWTRATEMDLWAEVPGSFVFVEQGTVNADSGWVATADQGGTLGTTAITFVQFSGAGQIVAGNGLTKTGNQLDVGAGTGISVAADTVGIDTAVVARKFTQLIGNGAATSIAVTHSLGNQYVIARVYDATTNLEVECDVTLTSSSQVTLGFTTAPATNAYRVVVVG